MLAVLVNTLRFNVMNENIRILILCVSVCYVVSVKSDTVQVIEPEIEDYDGGNGARFINNNSINDDRGRQVHSTVYQTVNQYYCSLDSVIEVSVNNINYADDMVLLGPTAGAIRELLKVRVCETYAASHGLMYNIAKSEYMVFKAAGSHLMLYGTKGWTFPVQDVNLTLRFPPVDQESLTEDGEQYIITGFKVILFIDGPRSQGFITDGGVLEDTITLSFISSHLTALRYEFWIFGVAKNTPGFIELSSQYLHRLCN